jgi:hypothetical protein
MVHHRLAGTVAWEGGLRAAGCREIVVYNSLAYERKRMVILRVSSPQVSVYDAAGGGLLAQILPLYDSQGPHATAFRLAFEVRARKVLKRADGKLARPYPFPHHVRVQASVPALGAVVYTVRAQASAATHLSSITVCGTVPQVPWADGEECEQKGVLY